MPVIFWVGSAPANIAAAQPVLERPKWQSDADRRGAWTFWIATCRDVQEL